MKFKRITTGIFDDTNEIVLIKGFAARLEYVSKFIITNTDTANVTPKLRIHNKDRIGEDDEYTQLIPEIELSPNERVVYESPVFAYGNQDLVIELAASVTTTQPQYIMVTSNV